MLCHIIAVFIASSHLLVAYFNVQCTKGCGQKGSGE